MLAREFGRADVDQFLAEISASQYDEWLALFDLEYEEHEEELRRLRGRQRA